MRTPQPKTLAEKRRSRRLAQIHDAHRYAGVLGFVIVVFTFSALAPDRAVDSERDRRPPGPDARARHVDRGPRDGLPDRVPGDRRLGDRRASVARCGSRAGASTGGVSLYSAALTIDDDRGDRARRLASGVRELAVGDRCDRDLPADRDVLRLRLRRIGLSRVNRRSSSRPRRRRVRCSSTSASSRSRPSGYGDYTAAHQLGRMLAIVEALLGPALPGDRPGNSRLAARAAAQIGSGSSPFGRSNPNRMMQARRAAAILQADSRERAKGARWQSDLYS